jgi:hypothetical protein
MQTPTQLRNRLCELGIPRDLRTLTDWRQKGLLPPLQRTGSGRGRGVKWFWSEDVLDQAIAVDWLISRSGRSADSLLGLWLSGYPVNPRDAKKAWIQAIKRVQRRRIKTAARYEGGFAGYRRKLSRLAQSAQALNTPWWQERPSEDRQAVFDLFGDTQEWLRDDAERDDDAFRYQIAELVIRFIHIDRKSVYEWLDEAWEKIDPPSFLAITPYVKLVESLSPRELSLAHASLAQMADILRHLGELFGPTDRVNAVIIPVMLMCEFFGALVGRILVKAARDFPKLPLRASISALHDGLIAIQVSDIIMKTDGVIELSARARLQLAAITKDFLEIWKSLEIL